MVRKLVVGLGNPGTEYTFTRHNVGFMVIDAYAAARGSTVGQTRHQALHAELRMGQDRVTLLKPQTYMNLSGNAVGRFARALQVQATDIIVIYDDMDLPPGRIRLRQHGGSGGHNGMKSIISALGTEAFPRIRLGIGRPPLECKTEDWVLSPPTLAEKPFIAAAIQRAVEALDVAVRLGWNRAMDRFNSPVDASGK